MAATLMDGRATPASHRTDRYLELLVIATPLIIGLGLVADRYASSAGHWTSAVRLLVVVTGSTAAVQVLVWLLTRRAPMAAAVAAALLLFLTGQALVFIFLVYLLAGAALLHRRKTGQWAIRGPVVGLVGFAIGLSGVINLSSSGAISWSDMFGPSPNAGGQPDGSPNIYLMLLDGYPRKDALLRSFGFDNSEFLSALGELGFDVYPEALSASDATSETLLEILGGSIPGGDRAAARTDTTGQERKRQVRRKLATAPLLEQLHARGYRTIAITSPIVHVEPRGWRTKVDSGQLSDLEIDVLARSPLSRVGAIRDWVMDDQRARQRDTFETLVDLSDSPGQQFVLAHVMSPHAPFLWTEAGDPRDAPRCWPQRCHLFAVGRTALGLDEPEFASQFVAQTEYLNAQVLAAAERMVATDPDAVIIVMSDHGSRHDPDDVADRFKILMAARTPRWPRLLEEDPRPAALLRTILGAYDSSSR